VPETKPKPAAPAPIVASVPTSSPSRAPYAFVAGALVLLALALGAWLRLGN
jgi:hypothetical protein